MNLNLDQNFKPLDGEDISFDSFIFSGGEPHIKLKKQLAEGTEVNITHRLNSFTDLGFLCLAADAIKRSFAILNTLVIPYFPAARQDRVMVKGEPLSVKIYADIINDLGFRKVIILNPHSEVTPALLNNCEAVPDYKFIEVVQQMIARDVILVSPDGGALKKIFKLSEYLGGKPVIECSKKRDVKTGRLTGFHIYADDLANKDCLVVDDICDGGGTFIGLAEELKNKNAGKLFLAVTHGIFSKGIDDLANYFTHIYATNSIKEVQHRCLTQIPIDRYILS